MTIKKYLKENIERTQTYTYVWGTAKIIHRRKFIFLNTYITKEKKLKNYYQDLQQKMMEKQIKLNTNWKK